MDGQRAGTCVNDQARMRRGPSPERRLRVGWLAFDVAFGLVLPIACLHVFHIDTALFLALGNHDGCCEVCTWRSLVHGMAWEAMLALCVWLVVRERVGAWSGVLAGCLVLAGIVTLVVACGLLPFALAILGFGVFDPCSFRGWCLLYGALYLVPFGTAAAFVRQGERAFRHARGQLPPLALAATFLAGAALLAVLTMLAPEVLGAGPVYSCVVLP